jgi:hypothetical protein
MPIDVSLQKFSQCPQVSVLATIFTMSIDVSLLATIFTMPIDVPILTTVLHSAQENNFPHRRTMEFEQETLLTQYGRGPAQRIASVRCRCPIFLSVCDLFNDALNSSDYMASNEPLCLFVWLTQSSGRKKQYASPKRR